MNQPKAIKTSENSQMKLVYDKLVWTIFNVLILLMNMKHLVIQQKNVFLCKFLVVYVIIFFHYTKWLMYSLYTNTINDKFF